jgi:microcystin-dependent protein
VAEGYIGEIRLFAGTYAPINWLVCDGSVLSISQYDALYSLIGTAYGGNGTTTFALPDLRGRLPMGQGAGIGLTYRTLGQKGGEQTVTLSLNQVPEHTHLVQVAASPAVAYDPGPTALLATSASGDCLYVNKDYSSGTTGTLNPQAITSTGSASPTPHSNIMPCLALNFIICTDGIYPSKS